MSKQRANNKTRRCKGKKIYYRTSRKLTDFGRKNKIDLLNYEFPPKENNRQNRHRTSTKKQQKG